MNSCNTTCTVPGSSCINNTIDETLASSAVSRPQTFAGSRFFFFSVVEISRTRIYAFSKCLLQHKLHLHSNTQYMQSSDRAGANDDSSDNKRIICSCLNACALFVHQSMSKLYLYYDYMYTTPTTTMRMERRRQSANAKVKLRTWYLVSFFFFR